VPQLVGAACVTQGQTQTVSSPPPVPVSGDQDQITQITQITQMVNGNNQHETYENTADNCEISYDPQEMFAVRTIIELRYS
jgi:hypothetical protein